MEADIGGLKKLRYRRFPCYSTIVIRARVYLLLSMFAAARRLLYGVSWIELLFRAVKSPRYRMPTVNQCRSFAPVRIRSLILSWAVLVAIPGTELFGIPD